MTTENDHNDDDTAKVPILSNQIDRSVAPEEDETKKNRIPTDIPSQWKCPWCDLTVFDAVETDCHLEARRCYKCGAIGIIGKVSETDDIIDRAMAIEGVDEAVINSHQEDRVTGLHELGLDMKSGYLEMEEELGHGTQGLWFRPAEKD